MIRLYAVTLSLYAQFTISGILADSKCSPELCVEVRLCRVIQEYSVVVRHDDGLPIEGVVMYQLHHRLRTLNSAEMVNGNAYGNGTSIFNFDKLKWNIPLSL